MLTLKPEDIQKVARLLEQFDTYYEMSDSATVVERAERERFKINLILKEFTEEGLQMLESLLNPIGVKNFNRYFKKNSNVRKK